MNPRQSASPGDCPGCAANRHVDGAHTCRRPARLHSPIRPWWLCRACGMPWPCGTARLRLKAEYGDNRVALCVYLATLMEDAARDLAKLNRPGLAPEVLSVRFLEWPRRGPFGVHPLPDGEV